MAGAIMAHQQPSLLIEQVLEELRKVLQTWNTACLTGKLIIIVEQNRLLNMQFHPSESTSDSNSALPLKVSQKRSHQDISLDQDHLLQRSKSCRDSCKQNFSSQLRKELLPRYSSQHDLISEKGCSQVCNKDEPVVTSQSTPSLNDKTDSGEYFPSKESLASQSSKDGDICNISPCLRGMSNTTSSFIDRDITEVKIKKESKASSEDTDFKTDKNQINSLSHLNQNVKPLKKRARLCTNFKSEVIHKSENEAKTDVLMESQGTQYHINDSRDINQLTDKNERSVKGEKKVKKRTFTCKVCMNTFSSRHDYRQHLRSHDGSFKCNVCGKILKTKDSLYHHQRGLHSKEKPYHCKDCNISFNFYHSYKLHLQRHKGERPYKCKYCNKSYLTFHHLKEHIQAAHSNTCIVCHICGKRFAYNSTLKLHLYKHSGELPFKCQLCPKRFSTKQALKIHGIVHIKEKNFQCETCGKCFKTEYARNFHSKKHSKLSKRFMCDVCGKTFLYKCILSSHVQIHSKLRPYVCDICDKTFKSKASLYTHKYNVHKEGLKFSCTLCSKSFKTKSCLTAHFKRHQNDIIYTCSTCGATFPDKGGLNKHMKTIHLPHKCFICKICGKTGTRADNMRTHVKSHKNEMAACSNLMDFIIEECVSDRSSKFQNEQVKVRQRSREPKHRSTQKLYSAIQNLEENRWIQPGPVLSKNVVTTDDQPQVSTFTSQESTARRLHNILINTPSQVLTSQSLKNFEKYMSNDESKSAPFFNFLCPPDTARSSITSGNSTLSLSTGIPKTSFSTISSTQEPAEPPYSFIMSQESV